MSRDWHAAPSNQRHQLEAPLRRFIRFFPQDEQSRVARVYLAWVLIKKGQLIEARQLIDDAIRGPLGTAKDFATVTEAALLIERQNPLEAIKLLRRLQGKIIDPVERFLATEQLVYGSLAAELYSEAMLYMIDWVEQAQARDRAQVRGAAESRLRQIPVRYLERALISLAPRSDDPDRKQNPLRFNQKQWLYDALSRRLAAIAVQNDDSALASNVMAKNPEAIRSAGDRLVLLKLATGGATQASIAGRTIGLVLSTANSTNRERSSQVARGLRKALNALEEDGSKTRLALAEEDGANFQASLSDLAAEGAALLVAGVDQASADLALHFANRTGIPVLLLYPSSRTSRVAFTLGVSYREELATLGDALLAQRIDATQTARLTEQQCSAPLNRQRFPLGEWQRSGVAAVINLGNARCASQLIEQAGEERFAATWAFGFEAQRGVPRGTPHLLLTAGRYPPEQEAPQPMRTMVDTWFEALGHDAGVIALRALATLPEVRLKDPTEVKTFHTKVRAALLNLRALVLWSSRVGEFDNDLVLKRELTVRSHQPDR